MKKRLFKKKTRCTCKEYCDLKNCDCPRHYATYKEYLEVNKLKNKKQ